MDKETLNTILARFDTLLKSETGEINKNILRLHNKTDKIAEELSEFKGEMSMFRHTSERTFEEFSGMISVAANLFQDHEERITELEQS